MKKIYDKHEIQSYMKNCIYKDIFSNMEYAYVVIYEKGEYISSPSMPRTMFQVVIEGMLDIYLVRDDGTTYSLSSGQEGYVLGDVEFFQNTVDNIYVEAKTTVICIAMSLYDHEEALMENTAFLRFVGESLAKKLMQLAHLDATYASLEQRVLSYMKYKCINGTLKGMEQSAFHLHCSARQLQRIMNTYVEEGIVEKVGKGSYRIL